MNVFLGLVDSLRLRLNQNPGDTNVVCRAWYAEQLSAGRSAEELHLAHAAVLLAEAAASTNGRQLVLLVHGIRTQAEWQDEVANVLNSPDVLVVPIKYEFLDAVRFWFPFFFRERALDRILWRIREARAQNEGRSLAIIAHSFGTYAVSRLLMRHPDLCCKKLLLCGGIVESEFRWDRVARRPEIVNECGSRDVWPILARAFSWGYGPSGVFGFGQPGIIDRFHPMPHSGYLNAEFAEKFWRPWLHDSTLVPSGFHRGNTPWLHSALTIPFFPKVIACVVVIGLCFLLLRAIAMF